jgi:hypothetical protein
MARLVTAAWVMSPSKRDWTVASIDHLTDPSALLFWGRRAELISAAEDEDVAGAWRADGGAAHAALDAP